MIGGGICRLASSQNDNIDVRVVSLGASCPRTDDTDSDDVARVQVDLCESLWLRPSVSSVHDVDPSLFGV